jgi:hypothetical protein
MSWRNPRHLIGLCAESLHRAVTLDRSKGRSEPADESRFALLEEACNLALRYAEGHEPTNQGISDLLKAIKRSERSFTVPTQGVIELLHAIEAIRTAETAMRANLKARQQAMAYAEQVVPGNELVNIAVAWSIRSLREDRPLDDTETYHAARAAWIAHDWETAAEIVGASAWIRERLRAELEHQ